MTYTQGLEGSTDKSLQWAGDVNFWKKTIYIH